MWAPTPQGDGYSESPRDGQGDSSDQVPDPPEPAIHPVLTAFQRYPAFQTQLRYPQAWYPANHPQAAQAKAMAMPQMQMQMTMQHMQMLPQLPQTVSQVAQVAQPGHVIQPRQLGQMLQLEHHVHPGHVQMQLHNAVVSTASLNFGVIVYDLETIHDAERGNYAEKGIHECSQEEQVEWKSRSQIIEFAAIDVLTGESICVRSRPDFAWEDVKSPAARLFAEDHGHAEIVKNESLPGFRDVWTQEVFPFLWRAAGSSGNLAMVAHNGDAFDHFVLMKEIKRLQLPVEGGPMLIGFDPVRTLKAQYGPSFGQGGMLALKHLYREHVKQNRGLRAHQAMDDCVMLLEVIQHWGDLNFLLANEIASQMHQMTPHGTEAHVQRTTDLLRLRLIEPTQIHSAPPQMMYTMLQQDREREHEAYRMWHLNQEPQSYVHHVQHPQVLLSTTAHFVVDDGSAQLPLQVEDESEPRSSASPTRSQEAAASPVSEPMGRSVADLEAELLGKEEQMEPSRRRGFPFAKDGTKREEGKSVEKAVDKWPRRRSWDENWWEDWNWSKDVNWSYGGKGKGAGKGEAKGEKGEGKGKGKKEKREEKGKGKGKGKKGDEEMLLRADKLLKLLWEPKQWRSLARQEKQLFSRLAGVEEVVLPHDMKPPKLFIELQDRLHADQYQSNPTLIFKHISELTGMAPRLERSVSDSDRSKTEGEEEQGRRRRARKKNAKAATSQGRQDGGEERPGPEPEQRAEAASNSSEGSPGQGPRQGHGQKGRGKGYYGYGYPGYFEDYEGKEWDWSGGYWGIPMPPYVAFWGPGGRRREFWAGKGYDYPNEASQEAKSPSKPPSKTTEDLGTQRWQ